LLRVRFNEAPVKVIVASSPATVPAEKGAVAKGAIPKVISYPLSLLLEALVP